MDGDHSAGGRRAGVDVKTDEEAGASVGNKVTTPSWTTSGKRSKRSGPTTLLGSDNAGDHDDDQPDCSSSKTLQSRSSSKKVMGAIGKFGEEKRRLVEETGFGDMLKIPLISKIDRDFTTFLLTKFNHQSKTLLVSDDTPIHMTASTVNALIGVPKGPRPVKPLGSADPNVKFEFIEVCLGGERNENSSLVAAEQTVLRQHPNGMSEIDKKQFKAAFVVYVIGYFLAPTRSYNRGSNEFWGSVINPADIKEYNWAQYVADQLAEAAKQVQLDLRDKRKVNSIAGCGLLIQLLHFDNLDIGPLNTDRGLLPRACSYTCETLRQMVEADTIDGMSAEGTKLYGKHKLRDKEQRRAASSCKTEGMSSFNEYLWSSKSDKLGQSQKLALIWFNARCLYHVNVMKNNIMEDNITLAKKLLGDADTLFTPGLKRTFDGVLKTNVSVGTSTPPWPSTSCAKTNIYGEQIVQNSAVIVPRRSNSVPVNIDMGGGVGMSKSEGGGWPHGKNIMPRQSPCESSSIGGYFGHTANLSCTKDHADSMALTTPISSTSRVLTGRVLFGDTSDSPTVPQQCVSVEADNDESSSTPVHVKAQSSVSPSTTTKYYAESAVMVRSISSLENINLNLGVDVDDGTESPLTKKVMGNINWGRPPSFYGIRHMHLPAQSTMPWFRMLAAANGALLARPWVIHSRPRHVAISGTDFKSTFVDHNPMPYEVMDVAIRRIAQLDSVLQEKNDGLRWRHFMESDFAMVVMAGDDPVLDRSVKNQLIGPGVSYPMDGCRMIIVPALVRVSWTFYFWDMKRKVVHILDPLFSHAKAAEFSEVHSPNVDILQKGLARCVSHYFDQWEPGWSVWEKNYVAAESPEKTRDTSGLACLKLALDFEGNVRHRSGDDDTLAIFSQNMVHELMSIDGNEANNSGYLSLLDAD